MLEKPANRENIREKGDVMTDKRYLRAKEVAEKTGMSISSVWRLSKLGKFPQPIKLSEKITVWKVEDVDKHLEIKESTPYVSSYIAPDKEKIIDIGEPDDIDEPYDSSNLIRLKFGKEEA